MVQLLEYGPDTSENLTLYLTLITYHRNIRTTYTRIMRGEDKDNEGNEQNVATQDNEQMVQ